MIPSKKHNFHPSLAVKLGCCIPFYVARTCLWGCLLVDKKTGSGKTAVLHSVLCGAHMFMWMPSCEKKNRQNWGVAFRFMWRAHVYVDAFLWTKNWQRQNMGVAFWFMWRAHVYVDAFLWTKNWHHEDERFCYMDVDHGPDQND